MATLKYPVSSLKIVPPPNRGTTKAGDHWQQTDGAEGLWRVHNNLYNLTDFVRKHPGGPDWISLTKMSMKFKSTLGIKYPKLRDDPLHSGYNWLKDKRSDDGAEGFWRIHDNLYDLEKFVEIHPGGADWLKLTKGTDITEAFEAHHITEKPEKLLPNYHIRQAKSKRNYPFTFHENGFYKTLKRRIRQELERIPENDRQRKSKLFTDLLCFGYVLTALLAAIWGSFLVGAISGVALSLTAIAAHNFFHQKDNFRMYYFNLTMMQAKEWRISHALSHHMYTNSINDLEVSSVEPFMQYLPQQKNLIARFGSWIYTPFIYPFLFIGHFLKTGTQLLQVGDGCSPDLFLPFLVPVLMTVATGNVLFCLIMFGWIQMVGSTHFSVVGLNAAHHHPDIFHDGDALKDTDWGVYQLDAVMDRKDINGSHFLVLTNFGDHALHHLFPVLDHGLLDYLHASFAETCREFGLEWRLTTQLELVKGQYKQLARVKAR